MAVIQAPGHKVQVVAGLLLTLVPLWFAAYYFRVRTPLFARRPVPPHHALTLDRETFIQEWTDEYIGNSPNESTIFRLCAQPTIKWRPNIVLNLDDANGGIGNVRGNILDFICLAITTGSSIMLPDFQSRSESDLNDLWKGKVPFGTFFDEEHFVATFATTCPKMAIYKKTKEHAMVPALRNRYGPPSMRVDLDVENTPQAAVKNLNDWLLVQPDADPKNTTLVNVGRTLWDGLDTRSVPSPVRQDLGGSLRLHPQIRRLAAIVTYNLAHRYHLDIDPRLSHYPKAFLGAHLRTEADAEAHGWLNIDAHANFSGQTNAYISQAISRKLTIIYTASGNSSEISRFTKKAWSTNHLNVTSKLDLLTGQDLEALKKLSWDQQALVDYEVLSRCSYLAGFVRSSFSFNIAISRNSLTELSGRNMEPIWLSPRDETVAFDDGLSKIWGRWLVQEDKMLRGAWP